MEDILSRHVYLLGFLTKTMEEQTNHSAILNDALNPLYNKVVISLEQIDHYYGIWKNIYNGTAEDFARIIQENSERLMEVMKSLYVMSLSLIEFKIRNIIQSLPDHFLFETINRKERIYDEFQSSYDKLGKDCQNELRPFKKNLKDVPPFDSISRIIFSSKRGELISEEQLNQWDFLLKTRNTVVHNNAIGSLDAELTYGIKTYRIRTNEMMQGDLFFFLDLLELLLKNFIDWIYKIYE